MLVGLVNSIVSNMMPGSAGVTTGRLLVSNFGIVNNYYNSLYKCFNYSGNPIVISNSRDLRRKQFDVYLLSLKGIFLYEVYFVFCIDRDSLL
ncbi:MAG: hypothetical protein ACI90U_000455 [Pseudomonadales bacterium]|jgi:hypothetical protein